MDNAKYLRGVWRLLSSAASGEMFAISDLHAAHPRTRPGGVTADRVRGHWDWYILSSRTTAILELWKLSTPTTPPTAPPIEVEATYYLNVLYHQSVDCCWCWCWGLSKCRINEESRLFRGKGNCTDKKAPIFIAQ